MSDQEKKHNKLVSWFLGLPKWGKILLVGGSVAGVATAVTVPIVVVNSNKGYSATDVEFKTAIENLKAAGVGSSKDNRNFEVKLTYKSYDHSTEETTEGSGNFKYANNFGLASSIFEKGQDVYSCYLGDGCYCSDEPNAVESQQIGVSGGHFDGIDLMNLFGTSTYDYKSLSFKNGCYTGKFKIESPFSGSEEPEYIDLNGSVTFNSSKQITKVYCPSQDVAIGTDTLTITLTMDVINIGSTTVDFDETRFPVYNINEGTSSLLLGSDFGKSYRNKIVILNANEASYFDDKTISVTGSSTNTVYFDELICGAENLLKKENEDEPRSINLSTYKEKLRNKLFAVVESSSSENESPITFKVE